MSDKALQSYLKDQIRDLEEKLSEVEFSENRYKKKKDAALRQLSYLNCKLEGFADFTKEFTKQLAAAKRKLEEINQS